MILLDVTSQFVGNPAASLLGKLTAGPEIGLLAASEISSDTAKNT